MGLFRAAIITLERFSRRSNIEPPPNNPLYDYGLELFSIVYATAQRCNSAWKLGLPPRQTSCYGREYWRRRSGYQTHSTGTEHTDSLMPLNLGTSPTYERAKMVA